MKRNNPITITKETSPYLYLTDDSGIYMNKGEPDRIISIPINPNAHSNFKLLGLQIWLMKKEIADEELFTIAYSGNSYLVSTEQEGTSSRMKVTWLPDAPEVYQNGSKTTGYLFAGEWAALNIAFPDELDFDNFTGSLQIYPGVVVNNIIIFSRESQGIANSNKTLVFDQSVGASSIVVDDRGTITAFSNGIDVFTDVEWATVERTV